MNKPGFRSAEYFVSRFFSGLFNPRQQTLGCEFAGVVARYFRPTEVKLLHGDPTKAKQKLGWQPKYDLPALVQDMVQADVALFKRDQLLEQSGHRVLNYFE